MSPIAACPSLDPRSLLLPLLLLFLPLLLKLTGYLKRADVNLPPSPPAFPFIGNLHQIGRLPHRAVAALSARYGPLMLLRIGQMPTLIVSSPEMAREVMRTHDRVFSNRPRLKAAGLLMYEHASVGFSPYGEYWKQVKKLCTLHLLSPKLVRTYQALREDEVAHMIGKISRLSSSSSSTMDADVAIVDLNDVLNSFSVDVMCRVISGRRLREDGRNEVVRSLIKESAVVFGSFFAEDFFPALGWLDAFFQAGKIAKRNKKGWDDFIDQVIDEHVEDAKHGVQEKDFVHLFLSHLDEQEMEVTLTRDQIKAIILDMFAAGTDTSNATLEWAMAELLRNPEVMKKLQEELRGIVSAAGREGDMVREVDMDKATYMKAVIKEVLRLHPPVPLLLPRESMEDCQIRGYDVPKKTRVMINVWAMGRDPKYWEDPEEFRPERFLAANSSGSGNGSGATASTTRDYKGNDFEFIPFGSGRRICPGMTFVTGIMELALANLVCRFDWEVPEASKAEEFSMAEAPGLTRRRKQRLHLVAKPWKA